MTIKTNSLTLEKSSNNFGIALFFSIIIAIIAGIFVLVYGKQESFILINSNHISYLDTFFKYFTYAGDGYMWLLILIICYFFKRKYVLAVLISVIISTLLSQFLKRVIFYEDLRPITFLAEDFPVRAVKGVYTKLLHSFPSGHATSAFTVSLILAYMINKKSWSLILPVLAFLIGYSRVYLAQHFVTDVFAGMCLGIISAVLSLLIYRNIFKKKTSNQD